MNVEELLNYQPSASLEESEKETNSSRGRSLKRKLPIEQEVAQANESSADAMDEAGLRRLIAQFDRKLLRNQQLRVKFADEPSKFLDSELELFDAIQEMHVLSTQPSLYKALEAGNVITNLLGLLAHENADIACAVISLLHELAELDTEEEAEEVSILQKALIQGQVILQLVSNMGRLDETSQEEADAIYNSLAIIENLLDFDPELASDCETLITWILRRLKSKLPFDGNRLYAVEVLCILLQSNESNRRFLGDQGGIDVLLQQIAYYKRHEPASSDEHEYMENLFDCLCSSLHCDAENRKFFFEGEGIELMNLILRDKRKIVVKSSVKVGCIKVLSHALNSDKPVDEYLKQSCDKIIEIYGLRGLFPVFMVPKSILRAGTKNNSKERTDQLDSIEEHCLTILLSLLRHCKDDFRARVLFKFTEAKFAKCERLIELHFKYSERLIRCEQQINKERARRLANDEEIDEEEFFLKRLLQGLFTLRLIDQIILILCSKQAHECMNAVFPVEEQIKPNLIKLLSMRSSQTNHYKLVLTITKELANELTDEEGKLALTNLIEEF